MTSYSLLGIYLLLSTLAYVTDALTPDGHALLEFKLSLNTTGATGALISNWKATDASPCSWGGVTCTNAGLVTGLNLANQAFSGVISPSLGKLQALQILNISGNDLHGPIPASLGRLYNLKELDISTNVLSGGIPGELGNLGNLTFLNVGYNFLNGTIPVSLGKLVLVENLNLSLNFLEGAIPTELAALPKVQYLDLSSNYLTGSIPPVLYNNTNLIQLYLSTNELNGDLTPGLEAFSRLPNLAGLWLMQNFFNGTIPPAVGNMTNMVTLILGSNMLTGNIPPELGQLKQLTGLGLYENQLSGPIPPELEGCTQLIYMDLGNNSLTGNIPQTFGNFPNIRWLALYNCLLTGSIPPTLYNLTTLWILDVGTNNLTGEISPNIGNLNSLQVLHFGVNLLTGPIPWQLANCTQLQEVIFAFTSISGPLPDTFWNLTHMQYVKFISNPLAGPTPSALANMVNLTTIFLENDGLSGPLPQNLGMVSMLQLLSLPDNALNGTLPPGLCQGQSLTYLSVTNNSFEGDIPDSLGRCATLDTFKASHNRFTKLPDGFGKNSALTKLQLSFNQLEGPLPLELASNSGIVTLYLDNNKISGNLSALAFAELPSLIRLNLSTNHLTGSIPGSISSCYNLTELDLSSNNLTGSFSPLDNLTKLQTLNLEGNGFSGKDSGLMYITDLLELVFLNLASNGWGTSIPPELGNLTSLRTLNMSYGQLSGEIPTSLGKLDKLEVLDLSHNALLGSIPGELGTLMTSLVSVNLSFNNLTGPLPPTWVKFLRETPDCFIGNPGLCFLYSADNQCVNLTGPSTNKDTFPLNNGVIGAIVVCSAILLVGLGFAAWSYWFRRAQLQHPNDREKPLYFTSSAGSLITFYDVMEATQNMSDTCILKKGAHGVVYKGTLKSGLPIVLKKIEPLDGDVQSYRSFMKEIETLGGVKHRNIVKLLGFCQWGKLGLILYNYIPKGDLHDALHGGKSDFVLDWPARLRIAEGVAHGLAYLHHYYNPPIVHRDVKASNVLLDDDLEPHLTDFGIAKVMATEKPLDNNTDSSALVAGTYGYIAPEYAFGAKVTPKMDVYSYGVLILELLTGKPPVDKSYGNLLHIVGYVRAIILQQSSGPSPSDIFDPVLLQCSTEAQRIEMGNVLKVALFCTQENPLDRPTSQEVEEMIRQSTSPGKTSVLANGVPLYLTT